jgi:hypothetical protein
MLVLSKTISTQITKLYRSIKVLRYGNGDYQTPMEAMPYGFDSNPIKDMVAVYAPTAEKGKSVIVGYLNKNQKAGIGELRLFATDESGTEKFYTWMKADGTMEIGGDTNYAVKFNELKTEFNNLKKSHNDLLTEYKTHVHPGVTVGMGSTGATVSTQTPNTSDIDNAKNDKIKTIG